MPVRFVEIEKPGISQLMAMIRLARQELQPPLGNGLTGQLASELCTSDLTSQVYEDSQKATMT
jgi:hypothetical protein